MQKIGNILEDNKKKKLFSKLKLGEHILTLKNLVTGYKIKEEYDDVNYLLTIIRFSIYEINKGNNKITELRTILQRESQNS